MRLPLVFAAAAALIFQSAEAGTEDHKYKENEHIELWVNKVNICENGHCRSPVDGLALEESIMNHASHLLLSVHAIIRSAHMLILKRHMNITLYLTVHRTQNTIQTYRKVAGTNGNLIASANIWVDTPYAIRVMTLYSLDPKNQKSVRPNH